MVKIVLPEDGSEDVFIYGVSGDTELAAREVDTFTSLNVPGKKEFRISGALEGAACKKWFSKKLDEAKQLIL
jgi:hypothetical protein